MIILTFVYHIAIAMPDPTNYNEEPVCYCANCFSLKIQHEDSLDIDYCADCGCSDIRESPISSWEQLYARRYGKYYVSRRTDPKRAKVFSMPIDSLKAKVYESPYLRRIINALYPVFPKGLKRSEAVITLFDKIVKDGRVNDLRLELIKYIKL